MNCTIDQLCGSPALVAGLAVVAALVGAAASNFWARRRALRSVGRTDTGEPWGM